MPVMQVSGTTVGLEPYWTYMRRHEEGFDMIFTKKGGLDVFFFGAISNALGQSAQDLGTAMTITSVGGVLGGLCHFMAGRTYVADMDKVKYDDNDQILSGLDDQFEALKKTHDYVFSKTTSRSGPSTVLGDGNLPGGGNEKNLGQQLAEEQKAASSHTATTLNALFGIGTSK